MSFDAYEDYDCAPAAAAETRFTLDALPPPVNNLYANVPGKGRIKSDRYRVWCNAVGHSLNRQMEGQPKWNEPVRVTARFVRPNDKSDLDNRLKALGDLMQKHGIVTNDKFIWGWQVEWDFKDRGKDGPKVFVIVRPWKKP